MEKLLNELLNSKFELNTNGTELKTTARNQLKRDLIAGIADYLDKACAENGNIEVGVTADGIAVSFYNAALDETISFVLDATFKKFDYDLASEVESFEMDKADKAARAKERADARAKKAALDAKMRAEKKAAAK